MPKSNTKYYWWCQVGGWGSIALIMIFVSSISDQKVPAKLLAQQLGLIVLSGIFVTHLFRLAIRKFNWLMLPIEKAFPKLIIGVLVVCTVEALIRIGIVSFFNLSISKQKFNFPQRLFASTLENGFFIIPWTLIYYFYHYIEKSRKQQLDTLKLESLVKALELKTIKSHINPHFIFNALNSIRALIDENPSRARTAITELSNILRSSMQAEKLETVTFEKELNIVKDYLALEHIRFEDRLQIEYEIDEETLNQPIPPMMLQTLVENAIKHGISKQLKGGQVKIISDFKGQYHELVIQNSGRLNGTLTADGFGLESTRNRLQLVFGPKASFDIREVGSSMVEAVVIIPAEGAKAV
ncbi:MAG: histidine kinase [Bacteroidetes bacterium]|nr:histidine kinase [Bacteroidota bacterium]MBS1975088.1 histidine kinase [Bacteroidota bacterium]